MSKNPLTPFVCGVGVTSGRPIVEGTKSSARCKFDENARDEHKFDYWLVRSYAIVDRLLRSKALADITKSVDANRNHLARVTDSNVLRENTDISDLVETINDLLTEMHGRNGIGRYLHINEASYKPLEFTAISRDDINGFRAACNNWRFNCNLLNNKYEALRCRIMSAKHLANNLRPTVVDNELCDDRGLLVPLPDAIFSASIYVDSRPRIQAESLEVGTVLQRVRKKTD